MKAVWFEEAGVAGEVLKVGERLLKEPGEGEVRVRLYASAVNPSDVKKRAGAQPPGFEDGYVIPHSDGAGVIESVGSGISSERVGQRAWVYQAQFGRNCGTAAQYVCLPSSMAAPLPENTGFEVGACMGIPVMTAHRCVFNIGDPAGKTILVTGASGRVGYYAAQWARLAGARVIGTAGSDERCAVAAQTGADEILNYRSESLVQRIEQITEGKGVDHIVDVEFGVNAQTSATVLKNGGTISTYSSSLAPEPVIPFYPMMFKNITLNMVLVYNMPDEAKQRAIDDIYDALENDRLKHRIAETWALEQTAKAHESIEAGGRDGCVVVTID
jgi:NADPH2:quinone reductase